MKGPTVTLILLLVSGRSSAAAGICDMATTAQVQEGALGQSSDFNWLGVLNVHLHEGKKLRIALTGIVLIKYKHALVNADDVARIPKRTFKSDSRAMFLSASGNPLYVDLVTYVTHPEYEYSTLNSIAIIELDIDKLEEYPLNPICLPTTETFNSSRYLFLTGYTDEHRMLEKVIYKIQYLNQTICEEFYNRAGARLYISVIEIRSFIKPTIDWLLNQRFLSGNFPSSMGSGSGDRLVQWCYGAPALYPSTAKSHNINYNNTEIALSSQQRLPSAYVCGYAPSNKTQCVWDSGMALVSNVTGYFHLIGFGVRGPGCAAPARFIDLFPYFFWIDSTTGSDQAYDYDTPEYRRRRLTGSRRHKYALGHNESTRYPFDTWTPKHHITKRSSDSTIIKL